MKLPRLPLGWRWWLQGRRWGRPVVFVVRRVEWAIEDFLFWLTDRRYRRKLANAPLLPPKASCQNCIHQRLSDCNMMAQGLVSYELYDWTSGYVRALNSGKEWRDHVDEDAVMPSMCDWYRPEVQECEYQNCSKEIITHLVPKEHWWSDPHNGDPRLCCSIQCRNDDETLWYLLNDPPHQDN